jgi:hypothetical protein
MTWTSMGTTNCCLCRKTESTLRNFGITKRLEGLGFKVTLEPVAHVA